MAFSFSESAGGVAGGWLWGSDFTQEGPAVQAIFSPWSTCPEVGLVPQESGGCECLLVEDCPAEDGALDSRSLYFLDVKVMDLDE